MIEVSAPPDEPPVFAVSDNGIGIDPEDHRSKIFQVFQHVHPAEGRAARAWGSRS